MLLLALLCTFGLPLRADDSLPPLAFERFELDNGLTVIVHEDRKAPIVAVHLWYHVGSKDEPLGRTGFAHLFEHLMFNGSANAPGEYFDPLEAVGATSMNGTTSLDRTNYLQTVPSTALELALWMESDRMGNLLPAIDQAKLDEQRGVVKNEKREGDNRPYGQVWPRLLAASFPLGHPYHHDTIGSMADLDAATLDDVAQWFRDWYGAANATLVLAGDIDAATARPLVERHFGWIGSGPPRPRREQWVAARAHSTRELIEDRVPQARLLRSWNVPPATPGRIDAEALEMAAELLGGGKTSLLYQRLVHRDQLADRVSVSHASFELAGLFTISVDVKAGIDPARVEAILDEEMAAFLETGPADDALQRVKRVMRSSYIRAAERVGGFGGKAEVLAAGEVLSDNPAAARDSLLRSLALDGDSIREVARRWLAQGDHGLLVQPFAARDARVADPLDRSGGPPAVAHFPEVSFPDVETATLSNGIEVRFARRDAVPVLQLVALFDGGTADDVPLGLPAGSASFAMAMLDEGAGERTALDIAATLEALGASLGSGASLDHASVSLSALNESFDEAVALFADVIRRPTFPSEDLERLRSRWLASIAQEQAQPTALALRLLPPLLYGEGHPYAAPLTGSGTPQSISALTREHLLHWQASRLQPERLRLLLVGDGELAALMPTLERAFGDWQPAAAATRAALAQPGAAGGRRIHLIDRPGAPQSLLIGGRLLPPTGSADETAIDAAVNVLGGMFSSRLNMNLREDKHWAYGAYAFASDALGPRPLILYAQVQTDRSAQALAEMDAELRAITSTRPPQAAELERIVVNQVRGLPGSYETASAVAAALAGMLRYGRPSDWVVNTKARLEQLTLEQVSAAAREYLQPQDFIWLVVGDRERVAQELEALGWGELVLLPAAGQ